MPVEPGRRTHAYTGELTVFLIGMRVNRVWRPDAWVPVVRAMGPMLRELHADPTTGFLGSRSMLGAGGPVLVQYWRSPQDLERYAADASAHHRPAWAAFNARARRVPGAVGIWHETFQVAAAETIYGDVPAGGLGAVGGTRPLDTRSIARQRLADPAAPACPVE